MLDGGHERQEAAKRLALWAKSGHNGMAMAVSSDVAVNLDLIARLEALHQESGGSFTHIELPWCQDSLRAPHVLLESLKTIPHGTVAVTALMVAFRTTKESANAIRVLNTMREALAELPLRQIWFCPPILIQSFRQLAPDLMRWFLVWEEVEPRPSGELLHAWKALDDHEQRPQEERQPNPAWPGILGLEKISDSNGAEVVCEAEARLLSSMQPEIWQDCTALLGTDQSFVEIYARLGRHSEIAAYYGDPEGSFQRLMNLASNQVGSSVVGSNGSLLLLGALDYCPALLMMGQSHKAMAILNLVLRMADHSDQVARLHLLMQRSDCFIALGKLGLAARDSVIAWNVGSKLLEADRRMRWRVLTLHQSLSVAWNLRDAQSLASIADELIEALREANNPDATRIYSSLAFEGIAEALWAKGELPEACQCFERAYEVRQSAKSSCPTLLEMQGAAANRLSNGLCLLERGLTTESLDRFMESATIAQSVMHRYPASTYEYCLLASLHAYCAAAHDLSGNQLSAGKERVSALEQWKVRQRLFGPAAPCDQMVRNAFAKAGIPLSQEP